MLAVTPLAQNDVVVDIAVIEQSDSILMSMEVLDSIMTEGQAKDIVKEWATTVKSLLAVA